MESVQRGQGTSGWPKDLEFRAQGLEGFEFWVLLSFRHLRLELRLGFWV